MYLQSQAIFGNADGLAHSATADSQSDTAGLYAMQRGEIFNIHLANHDNFESAWKVAARRGFDLFFAVSMLAASLPFLVILAIALQISSPGRLFFVQQRLGRGGKMFPCIKFRTMCENADAVLAKHLMTSHAARAEWDAYFKLRNDPRVTPLGAMARKFSLDEFPQLLNILAGHMSVVGPRPILPAEIERYGRHFADYCAVKPGLTGLWQVSGRNDIAYPERVALDYQYAQRRSILLDISIIARTLPSVFTARGAC